VIGPAQYCVHSRVKIPALVVLYIGCFAVAVAGIFATLRIAFVAWRVKMTVRVLSLSNLAEK
jgi:hypothetical protein